MDIGSTSQTSVGQSGGRSRSFRRVSSVIGGCAGTAAGNCSKIGAAHGSQSESLIVSPLMIWVRKTFASRRLHSSQIMDWRKSTEVALTQVAAVRSLIIRKIYD